MLLFSTALAANPQTIEVTYTVSFDLDRRGDQVCGFTGYCDCSSTYTGTGTLHATGDDRLTFQGDWKRTQNTCHDVFTVWTPKNGAAFHTLRWKDGQVTEWVVHRDPTKHERLQQHMKRNGQYWIDAIAQPWPATLITNTQRDGTTLAGGVRLDATHVLSIALSAPHRAGQ